MKSSAVCIAGNCANGQGTFTWSNGDIYVGEWEDGKQHGIGRLSWPEGDSYIGEWGHESRQGGYSVPQGAKQYDVVLTSAEFYGHGCVTGDCTNGHGTYKWLSGAEYTGGFKHGKRDGIGVYAFSNGLKIQGLWKNGKFAGKDNTQLATR